VNFGNIIIYLRKPDSKEWENLEQYIIGSYITLKKIDFELYCESTVWEVMDEEGV
jgi:hypothetical protein